MYICLCNQITDQDFKQTFYSGQASSLDDITTILGVASCCGCCRDEASNLVEKILISSSRHKNIINL